MLRDEVWAATGLGPADGVLCLDDVEQPLGRSLQYEDFRPTNDYNRDLWPATTACCRASGKGAK
jgi:hypothetical protein